MRAMGLAVGGATVASELGEIGALQLRGLVINAPGETMPALHRLSQALQDVPGVVKVLVEPPNLTDRGPLEQFGKGTESLRFLVTARLVPAGAERVYRLRAAKGRGSTPNATQPLPGGE